jgi:DNA-binding Xre family transcriptional regulator
MARLKNNFKTLLMKRYGIVEPARLPPQAKIAEDIGIWQSTVSLWLNESVTRFDDEILIKMCRFLRCNVGDLIFIEYEPGEREHA